MINSQDSKSRAGDILVVDDSIASLKLLTGILRAEGYQVRPADGPRVALQSALAHPPSLILLDVRMPGMDGFEVCRRLKQDERTRDVPIIFVSALHDVEDRVQGFEVGGVDFVSKPIEEAEVLARVKTHLQLRTMQLHLEELVAERTAELVQANEALRQSEERYRTLVEQAQDGIVVLQDGKVRFANSYIAGLSGRTVKELLDTPFEAYLAADQLPQIAEIYRRRMSGEDVPSIYEAAIQHRDGSRVEVEFNAGLTTYDGRPATLVFVRDIRERVKARQELEASQRLLSLVIDNVPAQVSYVDKRQRYRFVNRRYEDAYGLPPSEFVGKPVQEILGPEGYAAAEKQIAAALAGEGISYEHVFHYPDRGQRWMSIDYVPDRDPAGDVQGFVGLVRDISERKRAEEELRKSNERLEEAQRTAQIGDWEYDILAGKVTWSDEMYRIRGVDPEQYVPTAKSDEEFCHPDDVPALREAYEPFLCRRRATRPGLPDCDAAGQW